VSSPAPIRALILTAGLGTRLRPLTTWRAKPALPVAGLTLIERVIAGLAEQHIVDLILNLHYLPETITSILGDGSGHDVRIRYSFEQPLLGSAGGPRRAFSLVEDDRLWLVNGDTLASVDLGAMAADHAASKALVSMAVIPNPDPAHYGGVLVDDTGAVTGFSRPGSPEQSWHFIGIQIAERAAFNAIPDGVRIESVVGIYPELIARRRGSVRAFRTDSAFLDIGTPGDYLEACLSLSRTAGASALKGTGGTIASDAVVESTVLWDDVRVGARARLSRCVVTSGVSIPDGFAAESQVIEPPPSGPEGGGLRLTPISSRDR
jgi:NDP-sugar pyrophosphorylase family protein